MKFFSLKNGFRKIYKDLILILILIIGIEWWQSRDLVRGALPDSLKSTQFSTLSPQTQALWSPDKTTLLYVFAPWCRVCRVSASNLNALVSADRQAIALALSYEDVDSVKQFVEESGLETPVLLGQDDHGALLKVNAFPSYFLIDQNGQILKSWTGYTTTVGLWARSLWFSF